MDGSDFSLGISLISDVGRWFFIAKFEDWRLGEGDRTPEDPENGDAMKSELGIYGKPTILTVGVCKCKQGNFNSLVCRGIGHWCRMPDGPVKWKGTVSRNRPWLWELLVIVQRHVLSWRNLFMALIYIKGDGHPSVSRDCRMTISQYFRSHEIKWHGHWVVDEVPIIVDTMSIIVGSIRFLQLHFLGLGLSIKPFKHQTV